MLSVIQLVGILEIWNIKYKFSFFNVIIRIIYGHLFHQAFNHRSTVMYMATVFANSKIVLIKHRSNEILIAKNYEKPFWQSCF